MAILFILVFWSACIACLWFWKKELFIATWNEAYFADTPLLIESDDWGPGGEFHADRLKQLLGMLARHRDAVGRNAVLTADMVLAVPDLEKTAVDGEYRRKMLDADFPVIYQTLKDGIARDLLTPQLHGLEHLNGAGFARLLRQNDPRLAAAKSSSDWWDWESLDSPLQGHYVDGSTLPTSQLDSAEAQNIVELATASFQSMFGAPSVSTVAPCYLWNDNIEEHWNTQHISAIQTAGYRCTGRDRSGRYLQDPPIIRVGTKNRVGQVYLVRNVMYEPVDGKNTVAGALAEAEIAYLQAAPISISTHRYNFTRSETECNDAIAGLDQLISNIIDRFPRIRFLSSAELAESLLDRSPEVINRFNEKHWPGLTMAGVHRKLGAFLYRLYYRHRKLALLGYATGLCFPAWIICRTGLKQR
ncbi:hypothetical protein NP603_02580 [Methylomonas sp. SURF-1]|uniref:Uncharacterized protein n=1 Tax=Methylomonas aurea TaxID=2952224 RepID=A0ABT1UCN9_9GAMM|nr:hypothetical protein [Methylomonas sp. SURF-1]MCQ8179985.1 hypothetical protein [Methylomonas sp. SURF-1]